MLRFVFSFEASNHCHLYHCHSISTFNSFKLMLKHIYAVSYMARSTSSCVLIKLMGTPRDF